MQKSRDSVLAVLATLATFRKHHTKLLLAVANVTFLMNGTNAKFNTTISALRIEHNNSSRKHQSNFITDFLVGA